jgi:hypothetical protein
MLNYTTEVSNVDHFDHVKQNKNHEMEFSSSARENEKTPEIPFSFSTHGHRLERGPDGILPPWPGEAVLHGGLSLICAPRRMLDYTTGERNVDHVDHVKQNKNHEMEFSSSAGENEETPGMQFSFSTHGHRLERGPDEILPPWLGEAVLHVGLSLICAPRRIFHYTTGEWNVDHVDLIKLFLCWGKSKNPRDPVFLLYSWTQIRQRSRWDSAPLTRQGSTPRWPLFNLCSNEDTRFYYWGKESGSCWPCIKKPELDGVLLLYWGKEQTSRTQFSFSTHGHRLERGPDGILPPWPGEAVLHGGLSLICAPERMLDYTTRERNVDHVDHVKQNTNNEMEFSSSAGENEKTPAIPVFLLYSWTQVRERPRWDSAPLTRRGSTPCGPLFNLCFTEDTQLYYKGKECGSCWPCKKNPWIPFSSSTGEK